MKIAILTGNAIRHKFFANTLAEAVDSALIFSECKEENESLRESRQNSMNPMEAHFHERYLTEKIFFPRDDFFRAPTMSLLYKEVNAPDVYRAIKNFKPDAIFVFGSAIIREPLISAVSAGRFINLHLGISPYYRGSGTNFWPFVKKELEYVGGTIHHIDPGIDTGDIVAHVFPAWEASDDGHTSGCKVIKESVKILLKAIAMLKEGRELPRVKQWEVAEARYFRRLDFTEEALKIYHENLLSGVVIDFVKNPRLPPRYILLENN